MTQGLVTIGLLVIVVAGVTECATLLPLESMAARFVGIFPRAVQTIRNDKVSDHWKEKALLKLARLSLLSSICTAGAIFGLVALFVGAVYLLSMGYPPLWDFAMSVLGISIASVAAVLYLFVKAHAKSRLQRR